MEHLRNAELVNNATQHKATQHNTTQQIQHNSNATERNATKQTQHNGSQHNTTQHNGLQHNAMQHNRQDNRTHLYTTKQEINNHAHMLNKPVEVMSSSTKNSTGKNRQKTLQVYMYISSGERSLEALLQFNKLLCHPNVTYYT